MRSFYAGLSRNKHHLTFLLAFITSIVLYLSNTSPEVLYIRNKAITYFSIFLEPVSYVKDLLYIKEENALLREKNLHLTMELEPLIQAKIENERLRTLLNFKERNPLEIIPGTIISTGLKSGVQTAVIDIGIMDGVSVNNPVLTEKGVIGKLLTAADHHSIVQLINDVNYRLAVRIYPSEATGIMRFISGQTCEIREVPKNASVSVGNRVTTSGYSDIYPPDLPVGIVTGVYEERGSFQKRITVKIHNDLNSLNHIFVVKE